MTDVSKIMAKWRRIKDEHTGLDPQGGEEPEGWVKRKGSRELQGGYVKGSGKKRRQSKKGQLLSKDGRDGGTGTRQQGQADEITSKPKSVGRKQQSRRKGKGKSNQQTE